MEQGRQPPRPAGLALFWNRGRNFLIVGVGLAFHPVPMSNPDDVREPGDPPAPGVQLRIRETHTPSAEPQAGTGPQYFLTRDGEQVGPFSRAHLESMLSASEADPEELAWSEGMPDWRPLRELFAEGDGSGRPSALPPPDQGSAPRIQDSIWPQLWDSLSYPFRGIGPVLLVAGAVFFVFLGLLTRYGTLFAWIPALFASGYWLMTLQGIVQSSGAGEASPPTWPDVNHWVGDIIGPCLKWMVSLAVAFGPAYLCFRMFSSMDGGFAESGDLTSREQALWLGAALGLFLLGVVYFPMAILGVAMSDSLGALSPAFVARSIAAVPGSYAAAVAMLLGLVLLQAGIHALMKRLPIPMVDTLTSVFCSLYFGFVQARVLGVLYWRHRERLGWF